MECGDCSSATECDSTATGTGGNTETPVRTKQARRWCFTLNNHTDDEVLQLHDELRHRALVYVAGHEVGESGTQHLQGYCEFKSPIRLSTLKNISRRAHWEVARGSRKSNFDYCTKDDNVIISSTDLTKRQKILRLYEGVTWKDWQQEIIDLVKTPSDSRSIHWIWDPNGNSGKSFLCRYLFNRYKCVIGTGKQTDTFHAIRTWMEANDDADPEIIICDIPRHALGYINYGALEKMKDCLFSSGKYEGGTVQFVNPPHLICFANEEPSYVSMSCDRWKVKCIV